ncbi:MAG: hypothetical protein ABIG61_11835, partial [Planctomycetota bacterium]
MCKKIKFQCSECGSKNLGYKKFVKCITPVSLQENGQLEYKLSEIDEDDYLATSNGFVCMDCGSFIEHRGCKMETEQELLSYLTMNPKVREK